MPQTVWYVMPDDDLKTVPLLSGHSEVVELLATADDDGEGGSE